jgi:DNA polymerase III epsilon subunit family exonuclease
VSGGAPDHGGVELHGRGLVERAHASLAAGPLHTATLAERVLGVQGNARAAAAGVFSLLGTDPRFTVDAQGVWSLVEPPERTPARSLWEEEWVVVDVETTGGSPQQGHRVTEVAAVWVTAGEVTRTFSTLVNPERRIPPMITGLTGISDQMVRDAPRFHEIAPRVMTALRGRVFVAHNAPFDWRFLTTEMDRALGRQMDGRQLCTVRLARKLLPELSSRSLDALALYFGLEIEARHRALDDAVATARVLVRFLELLGERDITDWAGVQSLLERRAPRGKKTRTPRSMDSA